MKMLAMCLILMLMTSARGDTPYNEGFFRLHVLANSDSRSDQAAKLKARDAILDGAKIWLEGCRSAEEAAERMKEHLADVEAVTSQAAACPANAETGVFAFPDRMYGSTLVPAGDYLALRVMLGEGQGQNWWCVLYPDMCMPQGVDTQWRWKRILAQWCIWKS